MRKQIQPYNSNQPMQAPAFTPEQAQYLDYLDKTGQINLAPQSQAQYPAQNHGAAYPQHQGFSTQDAMQIYHTGGGRPVQIELYEGVRMGSPASYDTERQSNDMFLKVVILLVILMFGFFGIFGGAGGLALLGGLLS